MRRHNPSFRPFRRGTFRRGAGFTLLELMVSLALASVLMVAAYQLLDATHRVSHSQIERTEVQQAVRAAQTDLIRKVHTLGRGGLRSTFRAADPTADVSPADGLAIAVRDQPNVLIGGTSPAVAPDTDILVVRGSFENPIFYVNANDDTTLALGAGTGTVIIPAVTPKGNVDQDLSIFQELKDDNVSEILILVSAGDEDTYGVVQLDPAGTSVNATQATLAFTWSTTANPTGYTQLSALVDDPDTAAKDYLFPRDELQDAGVVTVAILEEYRYYIRDVAGSPRLSRARVIPGTEVVHPSGSLQDDLADGIADLQVALGFDSALDGNADGRVVDAASATDDWLLNAAADASAMTSAPVQTLLRGPLDIVTNLRDPLHVADLMLVRIGTLGRASVPDRSHMTALLDRIEDRDYLASASNSPTERKYRRELLQTVVEARNL